MPKPRHKKKRFIDPHRESTVTFDLVHRSQQDPLAADDEAPQRVLQIKRPDPKLIQKRKEEERKWGVFYDDEYDYMQHLKDRDVVEHDWGKVDQFFAKKKQEKEEEEEAAAAREQFDDAGEEGEGDGAAGGEKTLFGIPAVAFASKTEEKVGLLNRAAPRSGPRLDWDPDIVETLDDEFKHEQVFTLADGAEGDDDLDDFMAQAMQEGGEDDDEEEEDGEEYESGEQDFPSDFEGYGSEEEDRVPSLYAFSEEETKTRFTEYSMSSSVMPRSEHLQTLDDRFEHFFDKYEDDQTGALDFEDIEGTKTECSDVMKQVLKEHQQDEATRRQKPDWEKLMYRIQEQEEEDEARDVPKDLLELSGPPEEKWDCESFLSTYSNIYHHPKLISEPSKKNPIKISGKTGLPQDVFGKGLTASALRQLDAQNGGPGGARDHETATLTSRVSELSVRNRHETTDEKRARKAAFKEYKRERRLEKKANQQAFKDEKARQEKDGINNRRNVQGQKIV